MANILKREKQVQIIKMLVEGTSVRSVERITGVHRDTIIRLMVRTGHHCQTILDKHVRGVQVQYCQCDEIWAYVQKKQRKVVKGDSPEFGDAYTFVAFDQDSKLAISHLVGKRDAQNADVFMRDLSERIDGFVQFSTDAFQGYPDAIWKNFETRCTYGQVVKSYGGGSTDIRHRYSPAGLVDVRRIGLWGSPRRKYISTSHVERNNLTMRMQMRRFTRLTNAFSKKLANLKAAVSLHFAWYNLVRPHRSLDGITPAMAAGIESTIWSIDRLIPPSEIAQIPA